MAIALRRPHVDELLVGVLAEYIKHERISGKEALLHELFGYRAHSLFDMPGGLDRLADQTQDYWNLSAEDIAWQTTLFPYHAASCSPGVATRVLQAMKLPSSVAIKNRGGLGFGRFVRLEAFRYCTQCVADERRAGLCEYTHRAHQLPGVALCHQDGSLLHVSSIRTESPFEQLSESEGFCKGGQVIDIGVLDGLSMARLQGVARRSFEVLSSAPASSLYQTQSQYRTQLALAGYATASANVRIDALSRDITDFYGERYLAWAGMYRKGQRARDWLVPLLCQGQAVPPTFAHVLLMEFLTSRSTAQDQDKREIVIECPARYANHPLGEFNGAFELNEAGQSGTAKCSCGTYFSFKRCEGRMRSQGISRYGPAYKDAGNSLLHLGRSAAEVAQHLDVSVMTVRRLTQANKCEPPATRHPNVDTLRSRWVALFERDGEMSLSEARRLARPTYRQLLKYDREWLSDFSRRYQKSSTPTRVDWAARDQAYREAMQRAADELAEANPPRWVSEISILMVADLPQGTRNVLQHLPLCRQLLRERVEARAMFRKRVLRWEERQRAIDAEAVVVM
ncbi:TnsD family Tn7-like transposition protein [Caballeronia sp. J97]|uniref:TnsD family Tn7-like transposition protein n=1 Tax=Caballeronia sp. J97 TaxID=2805429 RepID=UPI002AB0095C|nr:TnsD family Tn7-like transposition protein [Caballeronia sp. J97]